MNYEQRLLKAYEDLCEPRPVIFAEQVARKMVELKADMDYQLMDRALTGNELWALEAI